MVMKPAQNPLVILLLSFDIPLMAAALDLNNRQRGRIWKAYNRLTVITRPVPYMQMLAHDD